VDSTGFLVDHCLVQPKILWAGSQSCDWGTQSKTRSVAGDSATGTRPPRLSLPRSLTHLGHLRLVDNAHGRQGCEQSSSLALLWEVYEVQLQGTLNRSHRGAMLVSQTLREGNSLPSPCLAMVAAAEAMAPTLP
jgi:hypothetical protein